MKSQPVSSQQVHPELSNRDRPRVVVSATASVDGRVTLNRAATLMESEANKMWQAIHSSGADELLAERRSWLERRYRAHIVLEGSGTFVTDSAGPPVALPPPDVGIEVLLQSYPPDVADGRWFVVVDGRGRIRWSYQGDDNVRLLVLVCRSTPPAYLAYLRRKDIPYLVAGLDQVNLVLALSLLSVHLGARCVVSEAGGGLNGALLREGLVDELHLVLLPALIGGRETPTIFDGPPLQLGDAVQRLRLIKVRTSRDGAVWLHYESGTPSPAMHRSAP